MAVSGNRVTTKRVTPGVAARKPVSSKYARTRQRDKSDSKGWVKWVVISFVIIPIIGFGFKMIGKSQDDREVLKAAHSVIASAPDYSSHSQYYDKVVDECHSAAFDSAYKIGGRHRSNSLNEKEYVITLLKGIKSCADRDGETEVGKTVSIMVSRISE